MKKIYLSIFLLTASLSQAQVGFGIPTPNASAQVDISATDKGLLIPRISLTSTTQQLSTANANEHSLLIYNNGTILPEGFYYWKSNIVNNVDNSTWIAVGSETASTPKFFYMPSVALPVTPEMVTAMGNSNITHADGTYTVNLHAIFSSQFSTPVIKSSTTASLNGFVLNANQYEYFVTSADASVFTVTGLSETGVLTYTVNANAIVRNSSFMNIVLKVK